MSIDKIKREISDLKAALKGNDIHSINDLVQYYFKWTDDLQKNKNSDDISSPRDQLLYGKLMIKYNRLIERAIKKLNAFIKKQTAAFTSHDSKSEFLSTLDNLIKLKKLHLSSKEKEHIRRTLLLFLSHAKNEEGGDFRYVSEILALPDPDHDERGSRDQNQEVPSFGQNANQQFLKILILKSFGNNYSALKKFSSVKIPDDIDIKLDCTIHQRKCDQFIPSRNTYFIAFPFNRPDIENSVVEACKVKFEPFEHEIAKNLYENLTALCQICKMILSSRFGIYVLTKDSQREDGKHVPNPNVMLELGLAMGTKKRTITLLEKGTDVPADVQGNLRIEFDDTKNIPLLIENTNFEKLLGKINQ